MNEKLVRDVRRLNSPIKLGGGILCCAAYVLARHWCYLGGQYRSLTYRPLHFTQFMMAADITANYTSIRAFTQNNYTAY
jgi:hypothetical protein